MKYRLVVSLLLYLISQPVFSQISSKRCQWIKLSATPITLDTLTVVPGSVSVNGRAAASTRYHYYPETNQFLFYPISLPDSAATDSLKAAYPLADSVLVCYRVLPLNLALSRYRRQRTRADSLQVPDSPPGLVEALPQKEEIFSTPGLNKTGTITRGISFGNKQNVFVNSALNLQLEGKLSEEINITAAITDQNIPFQPEGNTQQLQEFDKIFIALRHRRWNITGGDVVLQNKPNYFLKFYKNVQGGVLEVNQQKKNRPCCQYYYSGLCGQR
jgi:hypothetical protein